MRQAAVELTACHAFQTCLVSQARRGAPYLASCTTCTRCCTLTCTSYTHVPLDIYNTSLAGSTLSWTHIPSAYTIACTRTTTLHCIRSLRSNVFASCAPGCMQHLNCWQHPVMDTHNSAYTNACSCTAAGMPWHCIRLPRSDVRLAQHVRILAHHHAPLIFASGCSTALAIPDTTLPCSSYPLYPSLPCTIAQLSCRGSCELKFVGTLVRCFSSLALW
jgi:hypothetical protein